MVAAALSDPQELGLPFACWTLDRLAAYLSEHKSLPIKRSRISETAGGGRPALATAGDLVRRAGGPRLRRKKGRIETPLHRPARRQRRDLPGRDGAAKRQEFRRQQPVHAAGAGQACRAGPAGDRLRPARQRLHLRRLPPGDRRGVHPALWRAHHRQLGGLPGADVEGWLPADAGRVYAILDNLSAHRAADVLLFSLAHPRWEFVFQPVYAAYLNLIEPWWKMLRSLALKGRRFETWEQIARRWQRRPPIGTRTVTPSSGAAGVATGPGARRGWRSCRRRHELLTDLPDEPLKTGRRDAVWEGAGEPSAAETLLVPL